jgi:acyl dehydratase
MSELVWFDDLKVGQRMAAGPIEVDEAAAMRFAAEFDPQPFHLDRSAAEESVFKGLAISGWHTAALVMRLNVEMRPFGDHPIIGRGVDELRWLAPVRPGDRLRISAEILELIPSRSKPHGTVRMKITAYNQRDEAVFSLIPIVIVPRRPD